VPLLKPPQGQVHLGQSSLGVLMLAHGLCPCARVQSELVTAETQGATEARFGV
jgi:hypothetical protein